MPGPISQSYEGPDDDGPAPIPTWALGVGPGQFRCEMCGGVFDSDPGDDAEARGEAIMKGLDPADCGIVCDDCYALTPWGESPGSG